MDDETMYAAWVPEVGGDGRVHSKLVVVEADSPQEARRLSGLIEHSFHEADDDELDKWDDITSQPFTDRDVDLLLSLLGKEQRRIARSRARAKAEQDDLVVRVKGQGVELTAKGRDLLKHLGSPDGDAAELLRLLTMRGVQPLEGLPGHDVTGYKARKFAVLRGKLETIGSVAEAEDTPFSISRSGEVS